jgi:hypothetical protein
MMSAMVSLVLSSYDIGQPMQAAKRGDIVVMMDDGCSHLVSHRP